MRLWEQIKITGTSYMADLPAVVPSGQIPLVSYSADHTEQ